MSTLSNTAIGQKHDALLLAKADSPLEHMGTFVANALINKKFSEIKQEIQESRQTLATDIRNALAAAATPEEKAVVAQFRDKAKAYLDALEYKEIPLIENAGMDLPDQFVQVNRATEALGDEAMRHLDSLGEHFEARSAQQTREFEEQRTIASAKPRRR